MYPLRRLKKHHMGGTCQSFYRLCHTGATMEMKMATIRKRQNKWEAQIRKKGYLPHSKTFLYKNDAQLWARSRERSMDLGEHLPPPPSHQTLGDLLTRYAEEITPCKKGAATEHRRINRLLHDPIHHHHQYL